MSFKPTSTLVYLPSYSIFHESLNTETWTASRLMLGQERANQLRYEIALCFSNHIAARTQIKDKLRPLIDRVGQGLPSQGFSLVEAECLKILVHLIDSTHETHRLKASEAMDRE